MTVVNPKSISGINSITTGSGSDNILTIHTNNGTERLRVDSTGTTKIVTGIVTTLTATTGIVTTLTANTVTSLGAVSGTTGTFSGQVSGTIGAFSGTSTFANSINLTHASAGSNYVYFNEDLQLSKNGTGTRLKIDSSGRLLLGTTTEGAADADNLTIADSGSCGITLRSGTSAAGAIYFSDATSGAAEYDGAVIYNQSSQYMDFYTAQSARLRITSDKVQFSVDAKVASDNTLDLGASGARWKDLYLGGSLFLGGTGSANELEDYEEGTFTASLANVNAPTYEAQGGTYTKIGRVVHGTITIGVASGLDTSDGSAVNITGLPFTGQGESCVVTLGRYTNLLGSKSTAFRNVRFGGTYIILCENSNATIDYNEISSSGYLQLSFTYHTS